MSERDYEAEARAEGWVPESEWKGDPSKHVDAETFVKRGEEILPIVNAKNRKLSEEVQNLSRTIEELKQGNAEFKQFTDKAIERERREKEQAIAQLEAARKKAIDDGDGDAFDKADKKLNKLRSEPEEKKDGAPTDAQKQWLKENPWYENNQELHDLADGFAPLVYRSRTDLHGKGEKALLDALTEYMREHFPERFENPNRKRSTTEDVQPKGGNSKAKTYDNLPEEAKAACDKFVRTIPGFTQEAYLKEYVWD